MIKQIRATQRIWRDRITTRNQLKLMDKRLLRDIGLNSLEAVSEIRKPFWKG